MAVAIGCGSGGDKAAPVPQDQLVERLLPAYCNNISGCCSAPVNVAQCEATLRPILDNDLSPYAGLQVNYDATQAGRCVQAFTAAAQDCFQSEDQLNTACDAIWTGRVGQGQPCLADEECAPPPSGIAYCDAPLGTASAGVCATATVAPSGTRVGAGHPCSLTCTTDANFKACEGIPAPIGAAMRPDDGACYTNDGLECDSMTFTCTTLSPAGGHCSSACAAGAFCVNSTCQPQRSSGPCTTEDACTPATSYCDFVTTQCSPKKADGAPCGDSSECTGGFCIDDVCGSTPRLPAAMCMGDLN